MEVKYRPVLFPNGGVAPVGKKPRPAAAGGGEIEQWVYRECLRNHAAAMGGYAVDGCGEFMPDPASLRCAACGCHRNFHRQLLEVRPPSPPPRLALPPPPPPPASAVAPPQLRRERDDRLQRERDDRLQRGEETPEYRLPKAGDGGYESDETDEESDYDDGLPMSPLPVPGLPPSDYLASAAPHMLGALSAGAASAVASRPPAPPGPMMPSQGGPGAAHAVAPRFPAPAGAAAPKRSRTRFSPEQKQQMRELSERLGWRLQKRLDAVLEDGCREIGVSRSVFKVWMHNNKHHYLGCNSARRYSSASPSPSSGPAASPSSAGHAGHVAAHPYPSSHAAPPPDYAAAAASAPSPPPSVHTGFNINGAATAEAGGYYIFQPAMASVRSPHSS